MEYHADLLRSVPQAFRSPILPAALLLGAACAGDMPAPALLVEATETVSSTTGVGRVPSYAVSRDGAEAMVWVSAPDGGIDGRLYFSRGGKALELTDPLGPVEPHDESPPKLAFGRDSLHLYLLYAVSRVEPGRRFPASALRMISSVDGGFTWNAPVTITDDGDFGSHNFHALHVAPDGSVYVSWLDGRTGLSAAFITRSPDGGRSWEENRAVFSGEACPCCRTAMASAPDGRLYVAWRTVLPGNIRDIVVASSVDQGHSWTEPVRVHEDNWVFPGCPHAGPALQTDATGRLHVTWWTGLEGKAGVYYANSDDAGISFSHPVEIGVADFSRPASVQLALADSMTVLVAWSDGTMDTPAVKLRVSGDRGRSFAEEITLSNSARRAFFPVLGVRDSRFAVLWSEQGADYAAEEAASHPDMSDPNAVQGLHSVGATQVMLVRGRLSGGN